MPLNFADAGRVALPVAVFTVAVSLLLYFWPRPPKVFLTKQRKRAKIIDVKELTHDTKRFRLSLGSKDTILGLPTGKHIIIHSPNPESCLTSGTWNGKPDPDRGNLEIDRRYTPVTGDEQPGFVDVVMKIYRPGIVRMPDGKEIQWADGGKGTLFMDKKGPGDYIDIMGPVGVNEYLGRGMFKFPGKTVSVTDVGMMAGGVGLTPIMQVVQAALRDKKDTCKFSLIYANKTEDDIICRDMLEDLAESSNGRFKLFYTLDFPPKQWEHKVGFITTDMIKECLPPPSENTLILMCGPPPMIEFACKKNLETLGYAKSSMLAF